MVNVGELSTKQIFQRLAWYPQDVAEVDHRQAGSSLGLPPLPCHVIGLGPPNPKQLACLLHGQQQWKSFIQHNA